MPNLSSSYEASLSHTHQLWPHLSFSCYFLFLSSTLVLPCPRPLILLVLSSGIISSQLQEDSTSCAPAHHHQASYLCNSPEQYRVHPRCLPWGQASTGWSVDHRQSRPSHLQLHGQPGQHQGGYHGHGVSSKQEACVVRQPHLGPDMRQSSAGVQGWGVPQNPTFLYWDTGNNITAGHSPPLLPLLLNPTSLHSPDYTKCQEGPICLLLFCPGWKATSHFDKQIANVNQTFSIISTLCS